MERKVRLWTDGDYVYIELEGKQYSVSLLDAFLDSHPKTAAKIIGEMKVRT
jgi:hypothetical protein